ncbi:hypothetical protein MPSEU_000686800 [Mayamaea pseudoterrestris]|nr:hypothetical protein MPSEU_000686800 [Mayamaea pseudoterrestris]
MATSTNVGSGKSSSFTLAHFNLAAYVLNSVVVYGFGSGIVPALLGYTGRDNASISHKYQTLVTPADPAFGIWGIIYTVQLLWTLLIVRRTKQDDEKLTKTGATFQETDTTQRDTPHDRTLQAVGYNYSHACIGQALWSFLFATEQMTLAFLAMLFITSSLFRAVQGVRQMNSTDGNHNINYWLYKFPLTVHLGWILAATGLNFNVALLSYNFSSTTLFYTSMATLFALLFQALNMAWTDFDWMVPMSIVWALAGIYMELQSPKASIAAEYSNRQIDAVQWTAKIGASVIVATVLARLLMSRVQKRGSTGSMAEPLLTIYWFETSCSMTAGLAASCTNSCIHISHEKIVSLDLNEAETYEGSIGSGSSSILDNADEENQLLASCPVCYEDFNGDLELGGQSLADGPAGRSSCQLEACQHVFCRPCLQDYCTFTIASSRRIPIPCPMTKPNCETNLSREEIRNALVPEQQAAYQVYVRLERLAQDSALAPCPLCDELYGPNDIPQKTGQGLEMSHLDGPSGLTADEGALTNSIEVVSTDKDTKDSFVEHQQQPHDPNLRHCLNNDCPQQTFCAVHGSGHLQQSCIDFMAKLAKANAVNSNGATSNLALQNDPIAATQDTLSQFTKPCSHCGVALSKTTGCDLVVCPMCRQDFCWKCGTHEYLSGGAKDPNRPEQKETLFRDCSKCRQSYIDHRTMDQYWRRLYCCFVPLLILAAIMYTLCTLLICLASGFFCGCFACGTMVVDSAVNANETNQLPKRRGKFDPRLGVTYTIMVVFEPFIECFRSCGMPCGCLPQRSTTEREQYEREIPAMDVVPSEHLSR